MVGDSKDRPSNSETDTDDTERSIDEGISGQEAKKLADVKKAFELGNYRKVRELTDLLINAPDQKVVRVAHQYRKRIGVDLIHVSVLFCCLGVFLVIALTFMLR